MASSPPPPPYTTPYSSLFFSKNEEEECLLYPPLKFKSNIPFSWEQIPGIPKHLQESENNIINNKKQQQFHHLLPPPPAAKLKSHGSTFSSIRSSLQRDPFIAALVQCSKDDREGSRRMSVSRHRFGFINMMYAGTSCKRSACAVSESIVCFPR